MKAVIQRVSNASVTVDGQIVGKIQHGFLILLGVGHDDQNEDVEYLASKIAQLRVFQDDDQKMNRDIVSIDGNCLVISQFTLYASTKKGNRPSFIDAASPVSASAMYESFCDSLSLKINRPVEKGVFGADMKVSLINDGPVTILIDSKNK